MARPVSYARPIARLAAIALGAVATVAAVACSRHSALEMPPFPTATPATIPSATPYTIVQQTAVSLPASGGSESSEPVALPLGGGIAPTVVLPLPATATAATLTSVVTNVAPAGVPPLDQLRRAAQRRAAFDASGLAVLMYVRLYFDTTVALPNAPGFTFTLPPEDVLGTVRYQLALYDPTRPSLGWQLGFEGPGVLSGTMLTFTGNGSPFAFVGGLSYYFALLAVPNAQPTASPAPSISPTNVPTQSPPPFGSPSPTPSPTLSSSPGPGGGVSIGITVPTPAPIVCDPSAVDVPVNGSVAVSCSEAGYGGPFELAFADPSLANVIVPTPQPSPSAGPTASAAPTSVPTPTQTPSPHPSSAPTATPAPHAYRFTVVGVNPGTTTLFLTAMDGGSGSISVTVTP